MMREKRDKIIVHGEHIQHLCQYLISLYPFYKGSGSSFQKSYIKVGISRLLVALFKVVQEQDCHDLAKWLSHYLYFFSFLFLFRLTTQERSVGKCHITMSCVTSMMSHEWSHMITMGK